VAIVISRGEAVVVFEGVDEVESASCTVVGAARRVDVGCKEQLDGVDGVEVDVVQIQDLVELDALVVDGG
jgi:hypothetical protein